MKRNKLWDVDHVHPEDAVQAVQVDLFPDVEVMEPVVQVDVIK